MGLAFVWFTAISFALAGAAALERRARVVLHRDREGFEPVRAEWGGGIVRPPAHSMLVRALAAGARIVRSRSVVSERARGLRFAARVVACFALASALALVPFAGTPAGRAGGPPLVVVDLPDGLVATVVLVLLAAMAQVAVGLSESSPFARLACVRLAGRMLALVGILALVLAPLALACNSLRLHAIVLDQQRTLDSLPAWFVLRQPITALLFVLVTGLLARRPLALDPVGGSVRLSAFGHDDDAGELYWARVEERLAMILFASLFVALFLGAGAIPWLPSASIVAPLVPFFGEGLPGLVASAIETAVFALKLALMLAVFARASRATAALRDDQWIGIATRRALPLAWANLLLVAGLTLMADAARRGGA